MTAAQALKTGMLALSGAIRSTEAVRVDKSATSFKDTLDSASRSSANPSQGASSEPVRASDTRDYATKDRSDTRDDRTTDERDDGKRSTRGEPDAASTEQQTVVTDLSLVLAALGGAGAAQAPDGGGEFDESLVALQSAVANTALISETGEPLEQGPVLPGQAGEANETLDAAKLLALLKSPGVAEAPSTDVTAETVEVTATVLGQETHLAIDTLSQANGQVSETQETASTGAAQMSAKAAEGALDATERARGRIASEAATTEGEPVAERAGGAPALDTRSSVGGALADQGIAGQDGRQQEGGASSNGNSQQSSTGVFASMVAGARSQDVQSAADGEPAAFDPVSEQIAAEVRAELRADGLGESSSDGVVKVLNLQLKPANLGAMTVRLALKDNVISIHLETQHRDTLAVIEREREALVGALTSAGYTVDGVTTATQSDISRSSGVQNGFSDQGASASQGQANQGQGLANSSGGQAGQERGSFGGQAYSGPSDGKDISGNGARRDGDGLYV